MTEKLLDVLIVIMLTLIAACLIGIFVYAIYDVVTPDEIFSVRAEVLTIDKGLITGKINGGFLSSSSVKFGTDLINVGVKFKIKDVLFLEDLKLTHAELAYFNGRSNIDLTIKRESKRYDIHLSITDRYLKKVRR